MKKQITAALFIMFFTAILWIPQTGTAQGNQRILCFISVEGAQQGVIKGECKERGREGKIAGYGYTYSIVSPRDQQSGLPTGRRVQSGITITKTIGVSTPKLFQALNNNEVLKNVTIEFWGSAMNPAIGNGMETRYYTIKLTNASISRINQFGGSNAVEKNLKTDQAMEEVTFTYQKLEMEGSEGGITNSAMEEWNQNR